MMEFNEKFKALTGNDPLRWQCRLYAQWRENKINPIIDLPTGMGKTAVIAIWLIARADAKTDSHRLPTRLVYVVDRRTIVDQATALAEKIRKCAAEADLDPPTISTLRGQYADNREWTCDPSKPAIIIGTVDMIGSRLLFSGYRSSYKQRPLDAGLLGQDSLLILDEAHLSQPFARLLRDIGSDGPFQKGGKPMRVVRMSATTVTDRQDAFRLEPSDLEGDRESNVIVKRYHALKHLRISEGTADVKPEIVKAATELATDGFRVVVFVRSPDDAQKVADAIKKAMEKKKTPANAVEVLTGTMRGLERDELMEKPVMKRFLKPENQPDAGSAILVSTSAGEVGFDLNADHLVCDAAPLDSIIQRLGRVNRRGEACATVHLFAANPRKKKESEKCEEGGPAAHTYETAALKTIEILRQLPKLSDEIFDASPKALADLEKPHEALTPKPMVVPVTDILLDAWSMTTIAEPMPGRPPVADWLRGISDEDPPQTTIAWRAELDVDGFGDLDINDIEEWFDAHRVLLHETLTVPADKAAKLLAERWAKLADKVRKDIESRPCVIDQGGLRTIAVKTLLERLEKKLTRDISNANIILPASFGGIERGVGVLDSDFPKPESNSGVEAISRATHVADVADAKRLGANLRYRLIRSGGTEQLLSGEKPPDAEAFSEFILDLPANEDTVRQLISATPKPSRRESGSERQGLREHVVSVEKHAESIASELALESPIAEALRLAAKYHDHGKNRERWQQLVGGQPTPSGETWSTNTLGKSGGKMLRDPSGYRHEFGSLREFLDTHSGKVDKDILDIAAHLIATHHGRARPHFPKGGFDPDAPAESPEIEIDSMRRFARLQRKYGYWRLAWLENLLRCADALASAENDRGKNA